ncbi:MAG: hypothetical protein KBT36_11180 [Kurthia sp.]|nr:hypothetical protein [Candidatus Kurthia equi]
MKKQTVKGFFTGIAFTLCLVAGVGTVGAASKLVDIKVSKGGISIYVDEKLVKPTDAKGNVVEPMIYQGTTYLPVRAISNALGKDITWDGKSQSVYVGKAPGTAQTDISELEPYHQYDTGNKITTKEEAAFEILDKRIQPFNRLDAGSRYGFVTYILDSKYSALKADLVVAYKDFEDYRGVVQFYNVDPKGTETLIDEYKVGLGDSAIPVNVNLAGVDMLKIVVESNTSGWGLRTVLYNIVLEGAN